MDYRSLLLVSQMAEAFRRINLPWITWDLCPMQRTDRSRDNGGKVSQTEKKTRGRPSEMLAQFPIRIRPGANVGSIRDLWRETLFPSCRIRQAPKGIQKTISGSHHQLLGFRKCNNIEEPILNQHLLFADGAGVTEGTKANYENKQKVWWSNILVGAINRKLD